MTTPNLSWDDVSENENPNSPSPILFIVPIMLILGLVLGAVWYFMSLQTANTATTFTGTYIVDGYYEATVAEIRIIEVVSGHAWIRHSAGEVNKAFECIGKYGTSKAFKTFGFKGSKGEFIPTNLWMCLDKETGDWYAVITTIFEKVGENKVAKLVTAYKISEQIFPTLNSYIEHITNKWGAVVLNYAINAEKILLQPFK